MSNEKADLMEQQREQTIEFGSAELKSQAGNIHCLTIIGQIEGHQVLPETTKTTKYEHVIPQIAAIEESPEIDGLLILLNTVGGDIEAGLAIAELIAGMKKPTVSLVLGGGHSIGVPLAVCAKKSMIVPTASMTIHPVRISGTVIGAPQTYDYFAQMQNRILGFVASHCKATVERLEEMMMNTGMMAKDLGTILVGRQAVEEGLIDEIGGIREAVSYLEKIMKKAPA